VWVEKQDTSLDSCAFARAILKEVSPIGWNRIVRVLIHMLDAGV
jgi:hypothetical protein